MNDTEGHVLSRVRAVILDEIHVVASSPRGEQLRWLTERLRRLRVQSREKGWTAHEDLQVLALSATIPDMDGVNRRFLRDGIVVHVPGAREIERVGASGVLQVEKALPDHLRSTQEGLKVLVFSGSRRRVDTLSAKLHKSLSPFNYKVIAHHGSLSRSMREGAEEAAKTGVRSVCCATSTLEIGVDIGDIDLVVLDGPAPNVASFLQQIGRGNRRTSQTRVMLCADTQSAATVQEAMLAMARKGWVGEPMASGFCAVARQQVASYIFQAPQQVRSREKILELLSPQIGSANGNLLLDHMIVAGELICRSRGLTLGAALVEQCQGGQIHSTIESAYGAKVVDDSTGASIATGVMYRGGLRVDIAGHMLQVRSWDGSTLAVSRTGGNKLPAGEISYATSGKPPVDGQALALGKHLGLDDGVWPVVGHEGKDYVFHLGGRRRLELLQFVARTWGLSIKGNEFWITSDEPLTIKPLAFFSFTLGTLGRYVNENLTVLERRLHRPKANQHLPSALRERELLDVLGNEYEVRVVKESKWESCLDLRSLDILRGLLGQ